MYPFFGWWAAATTGSGETGLASIGIRVAGIGMQVATKCSGFLGIHHRGTESTEVFFSTNV